MKKFIFVFLIFCLSNGYAVTNLTLGALMGVRHADMDASWTPSFSNIKWYWKMNGATGLVATVPVDIGGTTCTTLSTKKFTAAGKVDQALSIAVTGYGQSLFCGSSAYNTISNNVTVAGWLKVQSTTPLSYGAIFGFGVGASCPSGNLQLQRDTSTNSIFLRVDTSGGTNQVTFFSGSVLDGTWHHIAFSVSSGVTKTYVDGVLTTTGSYTAGSGFASNDGGSNTCTTSFFTGSSTSPDVSLYDEWAIWNVVLSPADIATIYNKQVNAVP